MLKNFLCFQALLLAVAPAGAQLNIGPTAYVRVTVGTTLTIDSISLTPSASLSLNNIKFRHSNTPLVGPSIRSVYTSDVAFNFQGTLGLYYADAQLNGNNVAALQLAYRNGGSGNWITTTGTAVNPTTHFLSRIFAAPVPLSGITAGSTGTPLPITFFNLAAYAEERRVRLDCDLAVTDDHAIFELERSSDGSNFIYLGQLPVTVDRRAYRIYDNEPETGVNIYRLHKVGANGNAMYSRTCKVIFGNEARESISIYPNPVDNMLCLTLGEVPAPESYIMLVSMNGRMLMYKNHLEQVTNIDLHTHPSGNYIVMYYDGASVRRYPITKTK
jgi:hypothetical protein